MDKRGNNFNPNHFIMIPFEDPEFIEEYENLCMKIKADNPEDFQEGLLQKPKKLHMTVVVLNLGNKPDEKINKIKKLLSESVEKMKALSDGCIKFNFEKFDAMDNPSDTRVIYAKMLEDENYYKLGEIINYIISKLIDYGIIKEDEFENLHIEKIDGKYCIKLHLTLLNVTFLNKILKKEKKKAIRSFNAKPTLNKLKAIKLPECKLNKINFCLMQEDKETEMYKLIESYDMC